MTHEDTERNSISWLHSTKLARQGGFEDQHLNYLEPSRVPSLGKELILTSL